MVASLTDDIKKSIRKVRKEANASPCGGFFLTENNTSINDYDGVILAYVDCVCQAEIKEIIYRVPG
jgi:hypothetical protein